jgi:Bifunctional DNA primase/polymerase, N-terminal
MTMPETPIPRNADRINAALNHLTQGFAAFSVWSTLPNGVCKCVKGVDCTSPGKHPIPKDGFNAASTDPARVATMLKAGSDPNYGIVWPLGDVIVVIIDVDGVDWPQRLKELSVTRGKLPATKTTRTPSGGLHLFYIWPPGVPIPEGNTLHGFVTRFPMKGYVVGPGSAINGKVYAAVGPEEMAVLPVSWVEEPTQKPLIVVSDEPSAYEMPDRVETGHRHDEIVKLVASMWNRREPMTMILIAAAELARRFVEPMDEKRLANEVKVAYDTAQKKWVTPEGGVREENALPASGTDQVTARREVIEVGLLDAPVSALPVEMRTEAFTTSPLVTQLMQHWRPRTDASYEGLLLTTLVYAGALMGHTPVAFYGSREQHTNIMAMLVGTTGTSRKGTTVSLVHGALAQVTDGIKGLKNSANSGEGLIALAAKRDGEPILLVEEEFERFLQSKGREGSTLSSILRQAFDDIPLTSATAAKVVRADVHHVALLANTTHEEVTGSFARVDLKNGFANRILWAGVFQRPNAPVTIHDNALPLSLVTDLRAMFKWAGLIPKPLIGGVTHQITDPARDMLTEAAVRYGSGVGLAPFLSRRLDTIAARLALIYACLDLNRVIEVEHVAAALAVTDYAHDSAKWVFPETTGDARADLVLRHLQVAGFLNYTELEALVGKRPLDRQQVFDLLGLMGYARLSTRPRRDGKPGAPQKGIELA